MDKLLNDDWLNARRLATDQEIPMAGGAGDLESFKRDIAAVALAEADAEAAGGPTALAKLIETVCDAEGIALSSLHSRVGLTPEDIQSIIAARAKPTPRVVSLVAKGLRLAPLKVATIAGLAAMAKPANDPTLVRFATLSNGLALLDASQKQSVQEFIAFMSED